MNKSIERVTVLAATGALLTGCSSPAQESLYDVKHAEAIERMNSVTADEIITCDVTSAKAGEDASVIIEYDMFKTDEMKDDPYLSDEGTDVDGKHIEITWFQRFGIEHTFEDGTVLPGMLSRDDRENFILRGQYDSNEGHNTVTIPLNTQHQGNRETEPQFRLDHVSVGGIERTPDEPLIAGCGKVALNLTGTTVTIISY